MGVKFYSSPRSSVRREWLQEFCGSNFRTENQRQEFRSFTIKIKAAKFLQKPFPNISLQIIHWLRLEKSLNVINSRLLTSVTWAAFENINRFLVCQVIHLVLCKILSQCSALFCWYFEKCETAENASHRRKSKKYECFSHENSRNTCRC